MTVKELEALQAKMAHSGSTKSNATHQKNTKELTSGIRGRFISGLPSFSMRRKTSNKITVTIFKGMEKQLLAAYKRTKFNVFKPKMTIKIGRQSRDMNTLLNLFGETEWSYITSYNPRSKELTEDENIKRFNELKEKISGYTTFEGEGVGTDATWKPERSFLIIGISRTDAIGLGKEFEQNAIVYGKLNQPPELIIIDF